MRAAFPPYLLASDHGIACEQVRGETDLSRSNSTMPHTLCQCQELIVKLIAPVVAQAALP